MSPETLHEWLHQDRSDNGEDPNVAIAYPAKIREPYAHERTALERTIAEAAMTVFARESDPRHR